MAKIIQAELFPLESQFNSQTAKDQLINKNAQVIKENSKRPGRPACNYLGKRFGKLLVTGTVSDDSTPEQVWLCQCDCGTTIMATRSHFRHLTHCGCVGFGRGRSQGKAGSLGYKGEVGKSRPRRGKAIPNQEQAIKSLFSTYRSNAKRRGIEWHLSKEEFESLTSLSCHYCNTLPSQVHKTKQKHKYIYNGVDRKNSLVGYSTENCVPCCGICNRAKNTMEYNDFMQWIDGRKTGA